MEINDLRVTNVQKNSLTLLWLSGKNGNSHIPMREYKIFQNNTVVDSIGASNHRYDISGLEPETLYHFFLKETEFTSTENERVVGTSNIVLVQTKA